VIVVTGAASGIGAATARRLAADGATVWAVDRDEAGVEAVVASLPGDRHVAYALDVVDEEGWQRLEAGLAALDAPLDALIHCAGIAAAQPLVETSLEAWRAVLAVNLDGAFLATRTAVRLMQARGGAIVLVGSMSGHRPPPGAAAYATSKGALGVLGRAVARECREAGWPIRVNVLSPGGVRTPLWRTMPFFQALVEEHGSEGAAFHALTQPGERFADADDVAALLAFLVSPDAAHLNAADIPFDGGASW